MALDADRGDGLGFSLPAQRYRATAARRRPTSCWPGTGRRAGWSHTTRPGRPQSAGPGSSAPTPAPPALSGRSPASQAATLAAACAGVRLRRGPPRPAGSDRAGDAALHEADVPRLALLVRLASADSRPRSSMSAQRRALTSLRRIPEEEPGDHRWQVASTAARSADPNGRACPPTSHAAATAVAALAGPGRGARRGSRRGSRPRAAGPSSQAFKAAQSAGVRPAGVRAEGGLGASGLSASGAQAAADQTAPQAARTPVRLLRRAPLTTSLVAVPPGGPPHPRLVGGRGRRAVRPPRESHAGRAAGFNPDYARRCCFGRDTGASVWYKRSVHKRLATTETPA